MAHGKKYAEARAKVDRTHEYTPGEAVHLIKETKRAKFDESVEVHIRTGLNVRHADEQLRGTIALPHGLGKEVKIAVFARGDKAREAEEAGADFVGAEDLAARVQDEGFTDFDVAIATPDMMPIVGRLGRILGPQGKMPNPKVGTVTMDVRKAVEESKAGKVEYRALSGPQAAELRTRLRDADASFRVVKNTLTERAADKAGAEVLKALLEVPTAMTFVRGDAALAAKALRDFRRSTQNQLLGFKGGWMNGAPLTADQMDAIAQLPSREVLHGRLVGMVAAPLTGLVTS